MLVKSTCQTVNVKSVKENKKENAASTPHQSNTY